MVSKNTSHLAGEFLVAGELSRRGYPVSITIGNAKSVDIYANAQERVIKVNAKAGRGKGNWPITKNSVNEDVYYIFVYLQTQNKIKNNVAPEYFVVSGKEILSKNLIRTWKTRQGIRYSTLNTDDYKERWGKLPPP
ncbi:MAG: hypothetical protein H3Z51_02815 [archaeon]|nr:hypothetical protein [archaeon]